MPTKFQDDWFINSWEILTFRPLEKEKEKKEKEKEKEKTSTSKSSKVSKLDF